jgi:aryl-alcohol dehydrogenase-like predicted oxidoreductase
MRICGPGTWGEPTDRQAAKHVLQRSVNLGVNLIDTADAYGPGVSERLIPEALHPYPPDLVIATKGGRVRDGPYQWRADCQPASLRDACEASLRRLRLELIDLYQLHTVDPRVPLEESIGALVELHAEGKIRHIGVCNVSVEQ